MYHLRNIYNLYSTEDFSSISHKRNVKLFKIQLFQKFLALFKKIVEKWSRYQTVQDELGYEHKNKTTKEKNHWRSWKMSF